MVARAFKLRFRRRMRLRKLQVEEFGQQAEQQLERNFFKRLERLSSVRRFVATWFVLIGLITGCVAAQMQGLRAYYQVPQPVAGGTYREGSLGAFSNANPLYASTPADVTVSRLLFASLFTYDDRNNLVGDLATSITADEKGTTYTVRLKEGVTWHDGQPLTADDVAFTYQLIQNPDAQSPLRSSWQGITVTAVNPTTVTFGLSNQLVSFPYSLVNGIVPKHVLEDFEVTALRTLTFNSSKPIGAGPFKMEALEVQGGSVDNRQEHIALAKFDRYHGGAPKLDRFTVYTFRNQQHMVNSFKDGEIDAMSGLTRMPKDVPTSAWPYNMPLTAAVMTFFRTNEGILSNRTIRQALVRATNTAELIGGLDYVTRPVRAPLLQNQLGYNAQYAQAGHDHAAAIALLEQDGWLLGKNGIRSKDGTPLQFSLYVQEDSEYARIAVKLREQWRAVGAKVEVVQQTTTEFQASLASHTQTYDAVLHGISIGKDPDVFVYWDSASADSRAVNRLNFSRYSSATVDAALQAGRTRSDPTLRAVKYQPFLQAWQADAPALGLYQPRYLYIARNKVYGLSEHTINTEVERLKNVHNWMIRTVSTDQVR